MRRIRIWWRARPRGRTLLLLAALMAVLFGAWRVRQRWLDLRDLADDHARRGQEARARATWYERFAADWRGKAEEMSRRAESARYADLRPLFEAEAADCRRQADDYDGFAALFRAEAEDAARIADQYRRALARPWARVGPVARNVADARPIVLAREAAAESARRERRRRVGLSPPSPSPIPPRR